jgi:membrane protein implicated in regulation of membrane protease activity
VTARALDWSTELFSILTAAGTAPLASADYGFGGVLIVVAAALYWLFRPVSWVLWAYPLPGCAILLLGLIGVLFIRRGRKELGRREQQYTEILEDLKRHRKAGRPGLNDRG